MTPQYINDIYTQVLNVWDSLRSFVPVSESDYAWVSVASSSVMADIDILQSFGDLPEDMVKQIERITAQI